MGIIIFIIVLSVLVIVHELGHFIAAKRAGVRVDEFGLGFPPKMVTLFKQGETAFTLNWIPFGGFVKIFGENYDSESNFTLQQKKKFTEVSKVWQVVILVAGVTFNMILAWLLFSGSFMIGMPYSVENELGARVSEPRLTIVSVMSDSPAFRAGLKTGDIVTNFGYKDESRNVILQKIDPDTLSSFISQSGEPIELHIKRGGFDSIIELTPTENVASRRFVIGISMDMVGILKLPPHTALWEGAKITLVMFKETVKGLGSLLFDAVRGRADLSQVTGPVGIVGIVGDASILGFVYILTLTAFISINLAIINLVPIPSLDGGRVLFVIIEAIKGSPISTRVFNAANSISFVLLILAMILITIRDVGNLF
ncbi:MAG TPA: site-2 protease family protein [Candidatus Paceibacterota bacterium]